jgi:hypothetical protein
VLGGGGAPLDDPDPSFPGVQVAQKALSYAVVEVCGCHASGKVKDIAGKVIDSFRLSSCATPCGAPGVAAATEAAAAKSDPLGSEDESPRKRGRRRSKAEAGAPAAKDGGR